MTTTESTPVRDECRQLIFDQIEATQHPTPHAVTEAIVLEHFGDDYLAASLLRKALPAYVASILNQQRRGAGVRTTSSKWERAAQIFTSQIAIGTTGEWKALGDCSRDDLLVVAAQRRELAKANARQAKNFNALAGLMAERGAQSVRDLEPMTVRDVLNA